MIDLSYLTEEEQEMILIVLKRDADLKKAEEQRVKNLQRSVPDKGKLKYLTGEWFYETKSRRHRDRIHGSDIIRASMRQKKTVTILELSQMWAERPSFVNSENQDVYIPPELLGLLEEPLAQLNNDREDNYNLPEGPKDMLKPVLQSPTKQRQNPFNSTLLAPETLEETDSQLTNGAMELTKTPEGELPPPSESCITHLTNINPDSPENSQALLNEPVLMPLPKKRTMIYRSQDSVIDGPAAIQASSPAPRGILKHNSSCSSTDSLQFRLACNRQHDPQSPQTLDPPSVDREPSDILSTREGESLGWIDKKQVRFCPAVVRGGVEWPTEMQDGKELGEHSLLDLDCANPSEEKEETSQLDTSSCNNGFEKEDLPAVGSPSWLQRHDHEQFLWSSKPTDTQREVNLDEGLRYREWPDMEGQDTLAGPTQVLADQHEHHHAESLTPQVSDLHSAQQESGKPVHQGAGTQGLSPTKITEEDGHSMAKVRDWFSLGLGRSEKPQAKLPEQPRDEPGTPVDVITNAKIPSDAGSKKQSHVVSPKPRRGLLGIFSRGEVKAKSPEAQSPVEEEVILSEQKELDDAILNFLNSQSTFADKQSAETEGTTEIRTLELKFQEKITSVSSLMDQAQQEVEGSEGRVDKLPHKLFNLKSFWERENSGPKILISKVNNTDTRSNETPVVYIFSSPEDTSEQERHDHGEDLPKAETGEASSHENIQLEPDTTNMRKSSKSGDSSNDTPMLTTFASSQQMETTEQCKIDVCGSFAEKFSPSIQSSVLLKVSREDHTFRAKPILILEEIPSSPDDLNADLQIVQPKEDVAPPLPVSPSSHSTHRQGRIPMPLFREPYSRQENMATNINNLKSFWEKENMGPRIIVGKPKEALDSQSRPCSETSPVSPTKRYTISQSDLRTNKADPVKGDHEELYREKSSSTVSTIKDIEKGLVKQSSDKSQSRSHSDVWDVEHLNQQHAFKTETMSIESQERPQSPNISLFRSQIPRYKDSTDDELKRSPSKTCHPKTLPRDSSSFKGARHDSSPLKMFPIDIVSPIREHKEDSEKPTPTVRQGKGLSHEAMQSGSVAIKLNVEITSTLPQFRVEGHEQYPLTLPQRDSERSSLIAMMSSQSPSPSLPCPARRTSLGNLNVQQGSPHQSSGPHHGDLHVRRASVPGKTGHQLSDSDPGEQKLLQSSDESEACSHLARSFIPPSYQHYLGVPERTYMPHFLSEKAENEHLSPTALAPVFDVGHKGSEEPQSKRNSEGNPSRLSPWSAQNVDGGSSSSSTPEIWSQSRASSGCYDEDSSPVKVALKRDQVSKNKSKSSRPISLSRSLEDITSAPTRDERSKSDQRGELNLSVDDVSAMPPSPSSLLDPEQMKMSMSVPAFLQEEKYGRDNDCNSESSLNFGWRKKTSSSLTNLSLSSGMASMSSVSGSVMSIYSGDLGDVEVKGTVQFAMNYVQKLGEFHIFVIHCRDLAVAEPKKNRSDPYVKCYLLPDKAKMGKRKTSVKKKTLNPTYNEILRFKVTMETLKSQKLNVSVWHNDNFGRNSFLGEVDLDLSEWDFSNTQMNDYALKAMVKYLEEVTTQSPSRSQSIDHRGEMRVALRFLPQISYSKRPSKTETGEVQIWVKDCKNLPPVKGFIIDPFVKCTVLPDTSRKSRQKTRVVKRTANPMFNHTMVYDGFRPEDLREACVEITVWDHDRLNNHFIGGLRLGLGTGKSYGAEVDWMDSTSDESSLWERMMESHSEWVEDVLPLRMLMMAKSMSK